MHVHPKATEQKNNENKAEALKLNLCLYVCRELLLFLFLFFAKVVNATLHSVIQKHLQAFIMIQYNNVNNNNYNSNKRQKGLMHFTVFILGLPHASLSLKVNVRCAWHHKRILI